MANLPLNLHYKFSSSYKSIRASSNGIPFTNPKSGGPMILELPLEKIRRPLMRTRANDPKKVEDLMISIRAIGLQEPLVTGEKSPQFSLTGSLIPELKSIDVLEVEGAYYGFSGCHRYEAHQRLGLPTIRCKIRRGTKETLRHHMR